jgi:arylformamidase
MTWSPDLIDLTRPMTKKTGIDLGGKMMAEENPYGEVKVNFIRDWDSENGRVCQWTMSDHFGTHLDAPIHIVPNTPTTDQMDINRLMGEAVVLDCSFANGRGITSEDFERAKPGVRAGDIVLIYSAEEPATIEEWVTNQTYVTPDGAEWLVKKGIKSVGVEPFSFENLYEGLYVADWYNKNTPPPHWPAHTIVLKENIYIIEGLASLAGIVGKRLRFSALPLPVPGSSGSPVRAVAWEE